MKQTIRQDFPSVALAAHTEEKGVAATHFNSRREIMRSKKATDAKINGNTHAATGATAKDLEFEAEVLFQRIYDKWYAFSVINDDCLVSEVTEEEVQKRVMR